MVYLLSFNYKNLKIKKFIDFAAYNKFMKQFTIILLIAIFFTFGLAGYKLFIAYTHPINYKNEIIEISHTYNLEPSIVASLINVESGYKQEAKSRKNAIGLMQIKLDTAIYIAELNNKNKPSETELFSPTINIEYGCMYLQYLNKKFENIYTALAAYNAGETRVRSWLNSTNYSNDGQTLCNIPYTETKNYIIKIKNNLKFYRKIYRNL